MSTRIKWSRILGVHIFTSRKECGQNSTYIWQTCPWSLFQNTETSSGFEAKPSVIGCSHKGGNLQSCQHWVAGVLPQQLRHSHIIVMPPLRQIYYYESGGEAPKFLILIPMLPPSKFRKTYLTATNLLCPDRGQWLYSLPIGHPRISFNLCGGKHACTRGPTKPRVLKTTTRKSYIVSWTAHHSINIPPPAVYLHAVPSRAEVSRTEPNRAEAR
jgi:hypothetical protein